MWTVRISKKAKKQIEKTPRDIVSAFYLLVRDLEENGPEAESWTNYGKMVNKKEVYHCHLNKSKPRFVAIWKVMDFEIRLMEVIYAGSHEGADYKRIK